LQALTASDGKQHAAALNPNSWTKLKLLSRSDVTDKMAAFVFELPNPTDFTGLLPGQYLEVRRTRLPTVKYLEVPSNLTHIRRVPGGI
jgi:NAD(P)H-flavin reductase